MSVAITGVLADGSVPANPNARPLVPLEQTLPWARGEDGWVAIAVRTAAGLPTSLTGATLSFAVARAGEVVPLFTRAGIVTDALAGLARFQLVAADTVDLPHGRYRYDVFLTDDDGRHQIVLASTFMVLEAEQSPEDDASSPITDPIIRGNVQDLAALALVDASSLGDGFLLFVIDEDNYFQVRIGLGLEEDGEDVIAALGLEDGQWRRFVVVADGTASGAGDLEEGPELTGSNQTVTPGVSKVSRYVQRVSIASTVTVNIDVTGLEADDLVEFVREANTGAGTLTFTQTGPAGGSWTIAGGLPKARALMFWFYGGSLQSAGREYRKPS